MTQSIGAVGMDACSGQGVISVWTELALGGYGVVESPGCLDTWLFDHYRFSLSFRFPELAEEKSGERSW